MKIKYLLWVFFFGLPGCQEEDGGSFLTDSIKSDRYYAEEIMPNEFRSVYGKWRLIGISGGFSGMGYEPDFDYLEVKPVGIYGLVKNDDLFEYGMIELDTFDNSETEGIQVKIVPEYHSGTNPYFSPPEKYIYLSGTDSLNLLSPCCDMYNYHFKRVK